MNDGWRALSLPNGIGSVFQYSSQSAGRRLYWGIWQSTYRRITGSQQAGDVTGLPRPLAEIYAPIRWIFQPPGGQGAAPLRGVGDMRQFGRKFGSTSFTGMSGTPWLYWNRETSPTHGAPFASTEQATYCHLPVRQSGGEEVPTDVGRGDAGECGEGLTGLWKTAWDGHLF